MFKMFRLFQMLQVFYLILHMLQWLYMYVTSVFSKSSEGAVWQGAGRLRLLPQGHCAALFAPVARSCPALAQPKVNGASGGAGGACDLVLRRLATVAGTGAAGAPPNRP
jgi:hypothetical protein